MSGADRDGAGRPVVAAFDVDGTLTVSDCVGPFLRRLGGFHGILLAALRRPIATVVGLLRRDRDRLKEVFVGGVYRGRSVEEVRAAGREFARHVEGTMLRHDTRARLHWHQAQGHRTVLVSASLRAYLDPLAELLGVEHVVCTDVVVDGGRYTHLLKGPNCRAAEKVVRLRVLLATHGMEHAEVWAYGDSRGDQELLEAADHPVWAKDILLTPAPAPAPESEGRTS